ncbi:MAG: 4-(cytidine 5'-diphospho)-2-C-methyl-D-erythritol kinase [Lentisphaeria bacterium]|nr:4-(cytidine 5'-diphospho)-2-C-methyl-D-erythritol kinase [Lentisphaeria bacterium]
MSPKETIFQTSAAAKINLSLKLVGRRADGYHLLDSIFVPVLELADELTLTLLEDGKGGVSISSNNAEMTDAENNLCTKAFRLYCRKAAVSPSCRIHLEKKIPIGAGLGGGSSDCAAVLKLLNSFYHKLSETELHETALSLGADVPFFLINKISRVRGIGENITTLECSAKLNLLILAPVFSISTPWAFKHLDPSVIGDDPSNLTDKLNLALQNDDILTAAECLQNDFESLLFSKFPAYLIWKKYLLDLSALHVGISGSGSSFFALFANKDTLENARHKFFDRYGIFFRKALY